MMRDPVQLLSYEAKRRPVVQEMWERRETLTDEEIETAKLPLPWFRSAFKVARDRRRVEIAREEQLRIAGENPIAEDDVIAGANAERGTTVEYLGDTQWFKTGGRCSFEVEVKSGAWLFFPESGGVWDYQTFFEIIPDEFLRNRKIAEQTRHAYVIAWAEELCRRF